MWQEKCGSCGGDKTEDTAVLTAGQVDELTKDAAYTRDFAGRRKRR